MKYSTYQIVLVNEHDRVISQMTILQIISKALKANSVTKGFVELEVCDPTVEEFEPVC